MVLIWGNIHLECRCVAKQTESCHNMTTNPEGCLFSVKCCLEGAWCLEKLRALRGCPTRGHVQFSGRINQGRTQGIFGSERGPRVSGVLVLVLELLLLLSNPT